MIKDMTLCKEQWSKMSQEKRQKALSVELENLPKDYNFTFEAESNKIEPTINRVSQWVHFTAHNMFKCLVSC